MSWCGPHLIVAQKHDASERLRLFCWKSGSPCFKLTPANIPIVNSFDSGLTNVHVDLQEVILFMENLEYEKSYYGTSIEAIRSVVHLEKICVLNLHPQSLKILKNSDLMPYVVFVGM